VANQVFEETISTWIYSEFPYWFKYQVCMVLFLKQIFCYRNWCNYLLSNICRFVMHP